MAQGYLKTPHRSPPPTPLTETQLLRMIATQLEGIANSLERLANFFPTANYIADWEIRERLGLPHSTGGSKCPSP